MRIPNRFNGDAPDGSRQYMKGGGSSDDARQMEAERQARITAAVNTINSIFNPTREVVSYDKAAAWDPNQTYYDSAGNLLYTAGQANTAATVRRSSDPRSGWDGGVSGGINANRRIVRSHHDRDWYAPATAASMLAADPYASVKNTLFAGNAYTKNVSHVPTNERNALYNQQRQAVYDINALDIGRQYEDAERANRFALARSGLLGGSADVDSNALLQQKTNEGYVKAAGIADTAASDLMAADERAKQSLISMAQSGIDTGTAQQMALSNLNANAQAAAGAASGASIGSLFNDLSQAYLTNQIMQAARGGWQGYGNNRYGLGTDTRYGGSTG